MTDAYIYDAVRTPRGKGKAETGGLHSVSPVELAAGQLRALKERNDFGERKVDDVILGCVDPVMDQAGDIARSAALLADYGDEVPGVQINRFCASGLEAVSLAASRVKADDAQLIAAGGVEMMSRVGMGGSGAPQVTDPGIAAPHFLIPQGVSADLIATRNGYTRDEVDAYAVDSQKRAAKAWKEGRFSRSVTPVIDENGIIILDTDETVRPDADLQSLGGLNPSFQGMAMMAGFDAVAIQKYPEIETLTYVHHAGNSSQIVDGASAVLVGSRAAGADSGLKPRARILSMASIGSEPTIMLTGPAEACRRALTRVGMTFSDIDLWELNEAFAAVVLNFMDETGVRHEVMNVNGGAIAMGHPLGATGAMILGTLVDELERADKQTGVATLCAASGQAIAMVVERA
ncbi:MAG: acetyl-CoA C-acetyltransferase [Pseudomonadota bacterium]